MIHVSILLPENAVLQAIADPRYLMDTVNRFLVQEGKSPVFEIAMVGIQKDIALTNGLFQVYADKLIHEVKKTDLIIIPAIGGVLKDTIEQNKAFYPWIIAQRKKGAEVASLCLGAFLLASTGLLDGKKCSTHWGFVREFRTLFPLVDVQDGSIVTEENGLYSSGGAHSYWNLLLLLIEKYTDRKTAILASKYFAIDMSRNSQNPFIIFEGQKSHSDHTILEAQRYIEEHVDEKISVEQLAEMAMMSKRNFERRFKAATNNSASEYIQRTKIEASKRSFETTSKTVNEIMYEAGYNDATAFRTVFKKHTGLAPTDYKRRYNKTNKMVEAV